MRDGQSKTALALLALGSLWLPGCAQGETGAGKDPTSSETQRAVVKKGGGAVCGNGIVEGDEACDHPSGNNYLEDDCGDVWGAASGVNGSENDCMEITSAECLFCENAGYCQELTEPLTMLASTTAEAGPAAGLSRFALYNEVLDCVRDTKCASNTGLDCYCGTASSEECDTGKGNGLCKAQIERGLETLNPAEIATRFSNALFGAGLALARINCDRMECHEKCF